MASLDMLDGDSVKGSVEDLGSGIVHSKNEEKKLKQKKELFGSFSDQITSLFESLNNKYLKKELKNKKTVMVSLVTAFVDDCVKILPFLFQTGCHEKEPTSIGQLSQKH